jgi:2-C-methyl-D-erythritol 4-phosphate cytidylyltransferase
MKVSAIITAAGLGKRMGRDRPKQFLEIGGSPILIHTLKKFEASKTVEFIVITTEALHLEETQELIAGSKILSKEWIVVAGGKKRQDSVSNGLNAIPQESEIVAVHDGVRPFIETSIIDQSVELARESGGCIVAVPVKDTIKRGTITDLISETVDRSSLWSAQTPQTFKYEILRRAHTEAYAEKFYGTDEASLVERINEPIKLLKGSYNNIKITTPEDLEFAEAFIKKENL